MTTTIVATNAANSGKMEGGKPSEKDSLWCSYYRKNHHTRENCQKLHGKPSNFFGKNNGSRGGNSGYKPQSYVADIEVKQLENTATKEIFNKEEINKLKQSISQLEKSEGSSHFAKQVSIPKP